MNWLALITLLIQLESGGNDLAIGDDGKAWGCLQINNCVIKDVNHIYGRKYVHQDALDRDKSTTICYLYLLYWGRKYEIKTGKQATPRIMRQIWRKGPYHE